MQIPLNSGFLQFIPYVFRKMRKPRSSRKERTMPLHFIVKEVVQWLRIHLPMQRTRVQPLVWKMPRATTAEAHRLYSLCSPTWEATSTRSQCTTTRDSLHAAAKTQHSQKQTNNKRNNLLQASFCNTEVIQVSDKAVEKFSFSTLYYKVKIFSSGLPCWLKQ